MELEEAALKYLRGLAPAWVALFKQVAGLDLASQDLKQELTAPRQVDRTRPGFADFDPNSTTGVVPGDPASSLVYHALASPLVKPVGLDPSAYPTIADLDLIENYILSLAPLAPMEIPHNAAIAVFAYEYRPAPDTTHRRQADFVYSRTGISRVGETPPAWDGPNRCWLTIGLDSARFAVMPARYAAFIAVPRARTPSGVSVLDDPQPGDDSRSFLLPIRKVFEGQGCIAGVTLKTTFSEFHRREKLRRIFIEAGLPPPPGFDGPPYVRDSTQAEKIAIVTRAGASLLVQSPAEPLVRLAKRPGGGLVSLRVPPERTIPLVDFPLNRDHGSPSTFMIISGGLGGLALAGVEELLQILAPVSIRPRNAPEFVNIRHRITDMAAGTIEDMSLTLDDSAFSAQLAAGGYEAALFEDSICDGYVAAAVEGLPCALPAKPAFSVIAAPKFFPYADEVDINDWVEEFPTHNRKDQFQKGGPTPLHLGRFPPNLTLCPPKSVTPVFGTDDETAVAIVGAPYAAQRGPTQPKPAKRDIRPEHRTTTFLTDGCSGVFAPGWDVTFGEANGVRFYATFGLGSPFPEDVKLCAAANAFWPAAAPDAARTFNRGPTAIPMLDAELGYHPDNPRRGDAAPCVGWDGEQGPFIEDDHHVNFASIMRSDYVSHAFTDHTFSGARLKDVDSTELIARMDALRLCIQTLPEDAPEVSHTALWLVHAEKLADPPPAATGVDGPCYRYEFVVPSGNPVPVDQRRMRRAYTRRYVCYVRKERGVSWAGSDAGPFCFVPNQHEW